MVPLNPGAAHVRGVVLGETGYGQAQSRQGTMFQTTVVGDPQLQWLEKLKSSITIHLSYIFGEKGQDCCSFILVTYDGDVPEEISTVLSSA